VFLFLASLFFHSFCGIGHGFSPRGRSFCYLLFPGVLGDFFDLSIFCSFPGRGWDRFFFWILGLRGDLSREPPPFSPEAFFLFPKPPVISTLFRRLAYVRRSGWLSARTSIELPMLFFLPVHPLGGGSFSRLRSSQSKNNRYDDPRSISLAETV